MEKDKAGREQEDRDTEQNDVGALKSKPKENNTNEGQDEIPSIH